jgi:hypothetical protein
VEVCEKQLRISDLRRCTGAVVNVLVEQGTAQQSLGGPVQNDGLSLPIEVNGNDITFGGPPAIVFSTNQSISITIHFSSVPATCPAAGKTYKFVGTLNDYREENDCFRIAFAKFVKQ